MDAKLFFQISLLVLVGLAVGRQTARGLKAIGMEIKA
jgi:hypothetical protein